MNGSRRQGGAALLILCAIVVIGVSWMLLTAVGNTAQRSTANREHNARVLAEAKAALIGWIATQALLSAEQDPGRLPCPQAWTDVNTADEGRAATSCAAPAVGWLPWRELGLPKLLDSSGNQLWYVVSPNWHLTGSGNLNINSNTAGGLIVSGQNAVALIIAPGPALSIAPNASQIAAGCSARTQARNLASPATTDARDYLECQNATTSDYLYTTAVVDNGSNPVFNDQVLAVTTADILPVLEAMIAKRIEREIAPALQSIYATSDWGLNSTNPVFPFPADLSAGDPDNSTYIGDTGIPGASKPGGLLPFNQTQNCTFGATNPRCQPTLIAWSGTPSISSTPSTYSGGPILQTSSCSWETGNVARTCTGEYHEHDTPTTPIKVRMTATFDNVAKGLRTIDLTRVQIGARDDVALGAWTSETVSIESATMNTSGTVTLTFVATLPNIDAKGWGSFAQFRIRVEREVIADHSLLSTSASTGWFVRNEWYKLLYYSIASGHRISATTPRSCSSTTPTCVQVSNLTPANKQRAILILAGRGIGTQAHPSTDWADYLEQGNFATTGIFTKQSVSRPGAYNDRVIVIDANP